MPWVQIGQAAAIERHGGQLVVFATFQADKHRRISTAENEACFLPPVADQPQVGLWPKGFIQFIDSRHNRTASPADAR